MVGGDQSLDLLVVVAVRTSIPVVRTWCATPDPIRPSGTLVPGDVMVLIVLLAASAARGLEMRTAEFGLTGTRAIAGTLGMAPPAPRVISRKRRRRRYPERMAKQSLRQVEPEDLGQARVRAAERRPQERKEECNTDENEARSRKKFDPGWKIRFHQNPQRKPD
ncbi:hypothetical protein K491DRAFT_685477 [Lophiostoma macrostomum CBS 122681]|uniref:Uncharacterized protein n=1 Tax=Lophiostoma macrostomum CBS 122681 TaxID=1314788 RepID=A0A6A6SKG7_9PLEO|nr:hypothetical protein K491DRAFT_685477 [Lophiostoma macrostomum CBS 122681]